MENKIWEISKNNKLNSGKKGKILKKGKLNSDMIWKKFKLNSEKIWKIWK